MVVLRCKKVARRAAFCAVLVSGAVGAMGEAVQQLVVPVAHAQTPLARKYECNDAVVWVAGRAGVHRFDVELAITPEARERGLMHREEMGDDRGMMFLFDPPRDVGFWMKDTPLSLDIVFADELGRIIRIAEHTQPFSLDVIPSGGRSYAVLEVNAGRMSALGFGAGDRLHHPFIAGSCP